jgi:adenylate cyclase
MTDTALPRKLAAVLYADVADYSRLTGLNEEGTHQRLSAHLDLMSAEIESSGGRVVHYAGDAVLAEFPTVTSALSLAVTVQQKIASANEPVPATERVAFRIGVNLGEVIVDRNDIYGDGVNVAARLETLAEPGGICVSGTVFDAIGSKLELRFDYLGEKSVKNIRQPIRAYRIDLNASSDSARPGRVAGSSARRITAIAIVLGLLALAGGTLLWLSAPDSEPGRESATAPEADIAPATDAIAVLPFANLSGDAEQDYFSDGITNDLITDLSQQSQLMVIASNSVFVYKGTPVKVQQVAKDLGVRYVLEGSVQKAGDQVRINAQLIDAQSGHHLWADRFDRRLDDIFSLQDEISRRIVGALSVQLTEADNRRFAQTSQTNPEAYDLLLRGLESFRRFTRDTNVEARQLFLRAIEHDPDYARAHADVGLTYAMDWQFGWQQPTEVTVREALEYGHRALELDDMQPEVFFALGSIYTMTGQPEKALKYAARAVELNPNYADGYAQWSQVLLYSGRTKEALETLGQAMRLNPRHSFFYTWIKGHAHLLERRYDEAIALFENVLERNAHFDGAHLTLTFALAESGRIEDAKWQAQEILALQPDFSLEEERARVPYLRESDKERYLSALKKAGLPD